ncbi:MAG: c-type cytochrome [Planctomycetota bacterium]
MRFNWHNPAAFALLLVAHGCGGPTRFEPDAPRLTDRQIVATHRAQVDTVLVTLFGDPDHPRLPEPLAEGFDLALLRQAAGPVVSHTPGETQGLFQRHCARCHGVTGNGRGPTALYQHPYPRDFRRGIFKYKSTERGAPPTDADLHATLLRGAAGTAMPSFALVKPSERVALVQYVKFLAMRGQTERALIDYVAEELDFNPTSGEVGPSGEFILESAETRAVVADVLEEIARKWNQASRRVVAAASPSGLETEERIAAGRALFHDERRANCAKCHGVNGSGGVALKEFDDWNKRRRAFLDATESAAARTASLRERWRAAGSGPGREQLAGWLADEQATLRARREVAATLLPPSPAEARVLAGGVLRGGCEPADVYRLIHQDIAGTPMPGVAAALSESEMWDLVAYVRSLVKPLATPPAPPSAAPLATEVAAAP